MILVVCSADINIVVINSRQGGRVICNKIQQLTKRTNKRTADCATDGKNEWTKDWLRTHHPGTTVNLKKKLQCTQELTFHANSQYKHRSFHQTHWKPVHNRLGNPETKVLKEMAAKSKAGEPRCLITSWHPAATLIRKQMNAMPLSANYSTVGLVLHYKVTHDWLKNLPPLCHPMRRKSNHRDSRASVFPRFASARVFAWRFDWLSRLSLSCVIGQSKLR